LSFYSRPVPGGQRSAYAARAAVLVVLLVLTSCVRPATPPQRRSRVRRLPGTRHETPSPASLPLDSSRNPLPATKAHASSISRSPWMAPQVQVPAYVGIDRLRAVQAPMQTHDTSGRIWLEGREIGTVTLEQLFTVWGVRFDDRCLGSGSRRGRSAPVVARLPVRR
jgi:hypothetical protein